MAKKRSGPCDPLRYQMTLRFNGVATTQPPSPQPSPTSGKRRGSSYYPAAAAGLFSSLALPFTSGMSSFGSGSDTRYKFSASFLCVTTIFVSARAISQGLSAAELQRTLGDTAQVLRLVGADGLFFTLLATNTVFLLIPILRVKLIRREPLAEEPAGRVEYGVGRNGGAMKVFHARLKVSEFRTTLKDDQAMAALATTGESSKPVKGYSAPAAMGMPTTL